MHIPIPPLTVTLLPYYHQAVATIAAVGKIIYTQGDGEERNKEQNEETEKRKLKHVIVVFIRYLSLLD